jgi:fatty-acyl-CoA synthase
MMNVPMLLSEIIDYAADYHGHVEVVGRRLDDSLEREDWSAIRARSARIANALIAHGYDENARIASLAWNTLDHLGLFYGVLGLGIPLHTLNPRLTADDLSYMAEKVGDDLCFFDAGNAPLALELAPLAPVIKKWVFFGERVPEETRSLPGIETIAEFLGDASEEIAWPSFEEDRAATICFTSGTTGRPKGVVYSHRSITLSAMNMSMADMYAASIAGEAETVLPIAAMYHANAWMMPFTAPMNGQKLVLPGRRLDAPAILDLILSEEVTLAGAVPTIWLDILTEMDRRGIRQTPVRTALVAGTPLPPALADAMAERGITPRQSFGMTEVPGAARGAPPRGSLAFDPVMKRQLAVGRQGRVALQAKFRMVDEHRQPVPHDGKSRGLLQVRGATVCGLYMGEDGSMRDWLDTGDIGVIHPDATIEIVDRAKDAIKSGGEWISSPQLEAAASSHPDVREAAVIAIPDPRWQERPLLICVAEPGSNARPGDDELRAHMSAQVARWWLPERIEWVETLPKTPTGKLDKVALRKQMKLEKQ